MKGFLVIAIAVGAGWLFFFQLLLPWVFDRPLFPFFKSRERIELEEEIAQAEEDERLEKLKDRLYGIGRDETKS